MAVEHKIDNDRLLLRYPQPFLEVILSRAGHRSFCSSLGLASRVSPKPTERAGPMNLAPFLSTNQGQPHPLNAGTDNLAVVHRSTAGLRSGWDKLSLLAMTSDVRRTMVSILSSTTTPALPVALREWAYRG
jgi:hypothetical protein